MHSVPHRTAVPPQRFTAKEAIAWICLVLPDSFIGAQPAFLSKVQESTPPRSEAVVGEGGWRLGCWIRKQENLIYEYDCRRAPAPLCAV